MSNFRNIENYLFEQLNESDKAAFEKRLDDDTTLQSELELHRKEHRAMQYLHEQKLRKKMQSWEKEDTKVVGIFSNQNFKYALAASFVGICMVFILQIWSSQPNYQELAMQQHQVPSLAILRGTADDTKNIDNIILLIGQTEYEKALKELEALPTNNFEVNLLKATCYFKQKKFADAENIYKTLVTDALKSTVKEEMQWNLALTLLAKDGKENEEFKQLLKELKDNNFNKAKGLNLE